ncbi:hypothetical protein [Algibacter sp. L3A6]|uniref:hypothetical protein n=1 Tax=Algibacter sp. L3A6 TaxID=2686366 RepID=UPI00131C32D4|nr:hypothetical protein [Algibacter sp. L3A6]
MKTFVVVLAIPFVILAIAGFDLENLVFVLIYYYIYYFTEFGKLFHTKKSREIIYNSKEVTSNSVEPIALKKENIPYSEEKKLAIEKKRKEGYQKWLNNKKKGVRLKAKPSVKLKFTLSEAEFEKEISSQLNNITGSITRILWVGDKHRTHPWSLKPGGCTVVVLFTNKTCLGYDKVKRPDRYTRKISRDYISNHYSNAHSTNLEDYINEIYLTSDSGVDLKRVWHSNMRTSPWDILEKYRIM